MELKVLDQNGKRVDAKGVTFTTNLCSLGAAATGPFTGKTLTVVSDTDTASDLAFLAEHGVDISELMPLYAVAGLLGVPHEVLMQRYRDGLFTADDLGILGLWVDREDVDAISAVL